MRGYLVLENGEVFEGERIGVIKDTACEVVFNTAMVGYIENFTDPSYEGQGVVMTYPLIGNYGIIKDDIESTKIWAKAIFVHELAQFESNFRTNGTLESFLIENDIPGLKGVNTRKLTKVLRDKGTMKGYLTSDISIMSFYFCTTYFFYKIFHCIIFNFFFYFFHIRNITCKISFHCSFIS